MPWEVVLKNHVFFGEICQKPWLLWSEPGRCVLTARPLIGACSHTRAIWMAWMILLENCCGSIQTPVFVVVIWDIITWIIDQSLACQGQVQQFKNRKETDTSTMCSTGRVANLHRFKNPCGVKMSHAQIDCSTRNQRLCLTSISQEIYGATCKF